MGHSSRSKLQTLEEAAGLVNDGDQVLMGSSSHPPPMALLRQLVRRGVRDLRTVGITGGAVNLDFLVGAGVTASVDTCSVSLGEFARTGPNFARYVMEGRVRALDNT
jgi:acyl CoA:acetate/3-ketoacid CoA transferase alpha subunit